MHGFENDWNCSVIKVDFVVSIGDTYIYNGIENTAIAASSVCFLYYIYYSLQI